MQPLDLGNKWNDFWCMILGHHWHKAIFLGDVDCYRCGIYYVDYKKELEEQWKKELEE